jgi:DNA-directed RNA polymerase specialized sigma24 family protein
MKQPDRITNAFTTLREQMLSLAERITGNRDDAADAVQDAFVKLWQQRGRYETTRHAQGAGMMTVRTTSIDMARRNSHHTDMNIDELRRFEKVNKIPPLAPNIQEQINKFIDKD